MDQGKQLDMSSLSQSPRRQGDSRDNQSARSQQTREAGAVLETALATATTTAANPDRRAASEGAAGLKDVPVGQKLVLIALALVLPIALLLFFLVQRDNRLVNSIIQERQGVEYLVPITQMQRQLANHIGASTGEKLGDPAAPAQRQAVGEVIDGLFAQLEGSSTPVAQSLNSSENATRSETLWQDLKRDLPTLAIQDIIPTHVRIINDTLPALIRETGKVSGLILDPQLDSYYLASVAINELPRTMASTSYVRDLSNAAAIKGIVTPEERVAIGEAIRAANIDLASLTEAISSATEANTDISKTVTLQQTLTTMNAEVDQLLGAAASIAGSSTGQVPISDEDMLGISISSYGKQHDFYAALLNELDVILGNSVQRTRQQSLYTLLGVAAGLLLAFALIVYITRQITRPLRELSAVSDSVGRGDLSQLANIESRDEIGNLAKSFNNAILQLRDGNARQEAEIVRGQQLQTNIGEFLNVAMDIAQGDFTKRGQVSEDALGNVVDAINFMTEELSYVLKDVQNATNSVNQGATDMFSTADTIAQSAQQQASEAQKAREDVQGIRSTMRQVSDEMNLSAESATQALSASREGQQAVVQTLNGMQDIRREVQAVSKRVKNLGDRSLEISEIVETISRISEQTNLLAVNAAIESSGAGEAGLRFAVVADQVRKLAEDSAYAAERVSVLIKTVQDEVQEVITGVEAGTREVEEGYRVASQAGQRLEDISTIVERSAALAQRISKATQEQVSRVEQVGQVVEQMAEISQASQTTVSQGREAAERLRQLATQLSENLSRFRLA
jgi:twitching motility protein PilJ